MADLLPWATRTLGDEPIHTVNARDLYKFLEMTGDYNLWITRAIKRGNLLENTDFVVFYLLVENPKGGRHGEKVQAGTLLRIATRLGVSMEYLLTGRHRRDHEQGRSTDEKEYVHD